MFVFTLTVESEDDGNYFETMPDGTVRMKRGKRKIDISKLTKDDLRKLGIDPNMSKQDIARALKVCTFMYFFQWRRMHS